MYSNVSNLQRGGQLSFANLAFSVDPEDVQYLHVVPGGPCGCQVLLDDVKFILLLLEVCQCGLQPLVVDVQWVGHIPSSLRITMSSQLI